MVLKIEMLRCFSKVAHHGNLADAASDLGRTVSAVSMMLKQLEDHLGKPLFEADRKNKLSPVGEFVRQQAESQLRYFDHTVKTIEDYASASLGSIRIASVPSVAGTILPTALEKFIIDHPKVQIELRDMDSGSVLNALNQGHVDIGIATTHSQMQNFHREQLYTDAFGIVCSSKHHFAAKTGTLLWNDIRNETFIANELNASIQSPEFQEIHQNANLLVHNTISLLSMVKAGLGITVLPHLVVQLHPEDVVFIPVSDPLAFRNIDLLYRTGNTQSPAAESMCQYIITAANNQIC